MFKPKAAVNFPIGERMYQFICDSDSPLEEVVQVLKKLLSSTEKMLEDALKKMEDEKKEKFDPAESLPKE
jgi:predicted DNA-binding antitoxin AbrB/MazE fold protein